MLLRPKLTGGPRAAQPLEAQVPWRMGMGIMMESSHWAHFMQPNPCALHKPISKHTRFILRRNWGEAADLRSRQGGGQRGGDRASRTPVTCPPLQTGYCRILLWRKWTISEEIHPYIDTVCKTSSKSVLPKDSSAANWLLVPYSQSTYKVDRHSGKAPDMTGSVQTDRK